MIGAVCSVVVGWRGGIRAPGLRRDPRGPRTARTRSGAVTLPPVSPSGAMPARSLAGAGMCLVHGSPLSKARFFEDLVQFEWLAPRFTISFEWALYMYYTHNVFLICQGVRR